MFKKLKDKIAEEVKSSPSRIQELAKVAQVIYCVGAATAMILEFYKIKTECIHMFFLFIHKMQMRFIDENAVATEEKNV